MAGLNNMKQGYRQSQGKNKTSEELSEPNATLTTMKQA